MKVPTVHTPVRCPTCGGEGSINVRSARDGKAERMKIAYSLHQDGFTYREIAEYFGIQPSRAFEIVKEAKQAIEREPQTNQFG